MASKLEKSKDKVEEIFNNLTENTFKLRDIGEIFNNLQQQLHLPRKLTLQQFLKFLELNFNFQKVELKFPNRKETRYVWGNSSIFSVLMQMNKKGYFSHHTAMFFNNLTNQVPKVIYLNVEQPDKNTFRGELLQENLNRAFNNKQRVSNNYVDFNDSRILLINGKQSKNLGVFETYNEEGELLRITNIERTLIDIIVRPVYSGGVIEIIKAFEAAKERVSINKLLSYLRQLNYMYPYHQALGFYLTKTGYKESQIQLVKDINIEYDFYLDYQMKEPAYSKEWRLYYPKEI